MSLLDELKKPAAFGLSLGLLILIVVAGITGSMLGVILVIIAYFVGNAAGASGAPDLFRQRPKLTERAATTSVETERET